MDSARHRLAISPAMCSRKALLARQLSRGWMSSRAPAAKASRVSGVRGFPWTAASAEGARMGMGPATP